MKDITIHPQATIKETMEALDKTAEKVLLVVDDEQTLIGALTDGDIRRYILKGQDLTGTFVEGIKKKLSIRAKGRKFGKSRDAYYLREAQIPYNSDFTPEKGVLRAKNAYLWDVNPKISNR